MPPGHCYQMLHLDVHMLWVGLQAGIGASRGHKRLRGMVLSSTLWLSPRQLKAVKFIYKSLLLPPAQPLQLCSHAFGTTRADKQWAHPRDTLHLQGGGYGSQKKKYGAQKVFSEGALGCWH